MLLLAAQKGDLLLHLLMQLLLAVVQMLLVQSLLSLQGLALGKQDRVLLLQLALQAGDFLLRKAVQLLILELVLLQLLLERINHLLLLLQLLLKVERVVPRHVLSAELRERLDQSVALVHRRLGHGLRLKVIVLGQCEVERLRADVRVARHRVVRTQQPSMLRRFFLFVEQPFLFSELALHLLARFRNSIAQGDYEVVP